MALPFWSDDGVTTNPKVVDLLDATTQNTYVTDADVRDYLRKALAEKGVDPIGMVAELRVRAALAEQRIKALEAEKRILNVAVTELRDLLFHSQSRERHLIYQNEQLQREIAAWRSRVTASRAAAGYTYRRQLVLKGPLTE